MSTPILIFKDILHYTHTGYDPLALHIPYDFPRNVETHFPFFKRFTSEEFKAFWHNERNAYQWNHRSENNSRFYDKMLQERLYDDPLPSPEIKSRGRRRQYDWSVMHICKRARGKRQLKIGRESIGQGCDAKIRIQKVVDKDEILVTYHWQHNHLRVGNTRMPLGKNDIHWAQQKVRDGHTVKSINQLLTPSDEQLKLWEQDRGVIPPGILMSTVQIENLRSIFYRKRLTSSQRHKDISKVCPA